MEHMSVAAEDLEAYWEIERPRLVALCARLSGDVAAAEDLAQETLLEAWRHQSNLRDPERVSAWLSGIARNVCLRWGRQRGRHTLHVEHFHPLDGELTLDWAETLADDADLEVELERNELAELLDRALTSLPEETRVALVAHYLDDTPLAEIAARTETNANALAVRVYRGKLALRRILTTEYRERFEPYDPAGERLSIWQPTPLWCTICGRQRLEGQYDPAEGELWLRCPTCDAEPGHYQIHTHSLPILGGVKGFRRAYGRLTAWIDRYYPPNLLERSVPCMGCGHQMPLTHRRPSSFPPGPLGNDLGLSHVCPNCGRDCWEALDHLMLASPAGRAFARAHERIHVLPYQFVETAGRPAVIVRFESVTSSDMLAFAADAETFTVLRVDGRSA